jgi:hypothetical protein
MKSKYFFLFFFSGMSQRSGWRAVLQGDLRPILPARRYISHSWRQIWIGIDILPLEILSIFIDPPRFRQNIFIFILFFAQVTQHNRRHDWQKISSFPFIFFKIYYFIFFSRAKNIGIFSKKSLFTMIIVICVYTYTNVCVWHWSTNFVSRNPPIGRTHPRPIPRDTHTAVVVVIISLRYSWRVPVK